MPSVTEPGIKSLGILNTSYLNKNQTVTPLCRVLRTTVGARETIPSCGGHVGHQVLRSIRHPASRLVCKGGLLSPRLSVTQVVRLCINYLTKLDLEQSCGAENYRFFSSGSTFPPLYVLASLLPGFLYMCRMRIRIQETKLLCARSVRYLINFTGV